MRHVSRINTSNENRPDQAVKRDEDIDKLFRRWCVISARARQFKEAADDIRPRLLAHAEDHGEETFNGHLTVEMASPFTVPGGDTHSGFTSEKRVSRRLNTERIEILGEEKGLTDRFFRTETIKVLDETGLYGAHQEGLITDEELDSLIDESTTRALKSW